MAYTVNGNNESGTGNNNDGEEEETPIQSSPIINQRKNKSLTNAPESPLHGLNSPAFGSSSTPSQSYTGSRKRAAEDKIDSVSRNVRPKKIDIEKEEIEEKSETSKTRSRKSKK